MDIAKTLLENGICEITLSDNTEGGEAIVVRMHSELDETSSLALHQLATLRKARETIAAETQRLQSLVDRIS